MLLNRYYVVDARDPREAHYAQIVLDRGFVSDCYWQSDYISTFIAINEMNESALRSVSCVNIERYAGSLMGCIPKT